MTNKTSQVWGRFMAFFLDVAIAINLYSIGHSLGFFSAPLERVSNFFTGVNVPFGNFFPYLILILGTTWLFRLIGVLFFGVSFSQALMGIKANGSFEQNRLKGAVRCLAEIPSIVLFPLLDLGMLFNKRTFKEYISNSQLIQKKGVIARSIIFLPCMFILISLASFWEIPFSPNIITKFGILSPERKKDSKIKTTELVSNNWGFKTQSYLNNSKYVLIPSYQIIKKGNKNQLLPEMVIYDQKGKQVGLMRPQQMVPLLKLISGAKKYNPFFSIFYPKISKELAVEKIYKKLDFSFKGPRGGEFSSGLKEEIILYTQNALELNPKRPFSYVLSNGPFFRSTLAFRRDILNRFGIWVTDVEVERLGSMAFLVGSSPRDKNIFGQKGLRYSYIPLGAGKGQRIYFSWPKGQSFKKDFLRTFFSYAKWYPDYENIFPFPKEQSAFSALSVLDYYISDRVTVSQRKILQNYVIRLFSSLTKEALLLEDHLYQDVLVEAMDRLFYVAKFKNKKEVGYFPTSFLNQLRGLKSSIDENNLATNL